MANIRVHELAKQYGLTNEQMIKFLIENEVKVNTPMSTIDMDSVKPIVKKLEIGKYDNEHKNQTALKKIQIEGLFGKYDYDIEFQNDICIWVAENGEGKTTILNIIVALLNADRKTLLDANFQRISVMIGKETYYIDKTDMKQGKITEHQIRRLLDEISMYLPMSYVEHIMDSYRSHGRVDLEDLEYMMHRFSDGGRYERKYRYIMHEIRELQEIQFDDFSNTLYRIKDTISEELLFYPTYRRIEVSLDKVFLNSAAHSNREVTKYIGFGMDDVKERIKGLLDKMGQDANNSYVEMNGSIISDLLKSSSITELTKNIPKINRHKVEVVIKRIGEEHIENIDKLKEFVNGRSENPNEEFLKFYLDKLVKIYDSQKAIDEKLSKFANICTKYLSGKKIVYDEALLSMNVYDVDYKKIDFEDLSSGEKQIVSIFSKVYLDVTTSAIFIIDEPEISLSIEWQRMFLEDIYASGKIGLLIATTHSPFIFKNKFREFTTEIDIYKKIGE